MKGVKIKKIFITFFTLVLGLIAFGFYQQNQSNKHSSTSNLNVDLSKNQSLNVDACNLSGKREANKVVDVGFGERKYYAYTNSTAQLIKVSAKKLEIQNKNENLINGRYCKDEAKVSGTEKKEYDEGHVIADSLGGASNSYNITPQDSFLNRKGKQYQMEDELRKAIVENHDVHDFNAIISYPNSSSTIPNHYHIEVYIDNNKKIYDYDNKHF